METKEYTPDGYCPRCGYATDIGVCPECGTAIDKDSLLAFRWEFREKAIERRARRVAVLLLLAAVAYYAYSAYPRVSVSRRDDGTIRSEVTWRRSLSGRRYANGPRRDYYPDGTLWRETDMRKGRRTGTMITYRRDGSKESMVTYENGCPHGLSEIYNMDGSLASEGEYFQGKMHGTWIFYSGEIVPGESGACHSEMVWAYGELKSSQIKCENYP